MEAPFTAPTAALEAVQRRTAATVVKCKDCSIILSPIGSVVQQRYRDWTLKIENLVENGQEILKYGQGAVYCSH